MYNYIWITNQVENKRIKSSDVIPTGWKKGRKLPASFTTKGTIQTVESNEKRRQALLGRQSPNKGNTSPKKGLSEIEYYGEEKAAQLAKMRSIARTGKTPWNLGIPQSEETKVKIGKANETSWNRESVRYKRWSGLVVSRDKFTCQHCGTSGRIIAHHVKSWIDYPELRFISPNGLALCGKCHYSLEAVLQVLKKNMIQLQIIVVSNGSKICSSCHRLKQVNNLENVEGCLCKKPA